MWILRAFIGLINVSWFAKIRIVEWYVIDELVASPLIGSNYELSGSWQRLVACSK